MIIEDAKSVERKCLFPLSLTEKKNYKFYKSHKK